MFYRSLHEGVMDCGSAQGPPVRQGFHGVDGNAPCKQVCHVARQRTLACRVPGEPGLQRGEPVKFRDISFVHPACCLNFSRN